MLLVLLVILLLFAAVQAIAAQRLLIAAIWLAGVSALLAVILYALGATTVAVIELSVGAGLVTVLFVFAISISGEEILDKWHVVPRVTAGGIVTALVILLGGMLITSARQTPPLTALMQAPLETPFSVVFWQQRDLDVMVQLVVVFAGVLTVLGLLNDVRIPDPSDQKVAQPVVKAISSPVCEDPTTGTTETTQPISSLQEPSPEPVAKEVAR